MSYCLCIEPTVFTDVRDNTVSYGYRWYDDGGQGYDNTWDSIPSEDSDVLRRVLMLADEALRDALHSICHHMDPNAAYLYVGSTSFTGAEIQRIRDEVWDQEGV